MISVLQLVWGKIYLQFLIVRLYCIALQTKYYLTLLRNAEFKKYRVSRDPHIIQHWRYEANSYGKDTLFYKVFCKLADDLEKL